MLAQQEADKAPAVAEKAPTVTSPTSPPILRKSNSKPRPKKHATFNVSETTKSTTSYDLGKEIYELTNDTGTVAEDFHTDIVPKKETTFSENADFVLTKDHAEVGEDFHTNIVERKETTFHESNDALDRSSEKINGSVEKINGSLEVVNGSIEQLNRSYEKVPEVNTNVKTRVTVTETHKQNSDPVLESKVAADETVLDEKFLSASSKRESSEEDTKPAPAVPVQPDAAPVLKSSSSVMIQRSYTHTSNTMPARGKPWEKTQEPTAVAVNGSSYSNGTSFSDEKSSSSSSYSMQRRYTEPESSIKYERVPGYAGYKSGLPKFRPVPVKKNNLEGETNFADEISAELMSQLDDLENEVRASNQALNNHKQHEPPEIIVDELKGHIDNVVNTSYVPPQVVVPQVVVNQDVETHVVTRSPKVEESAASSTVNLNSTVNITTDSRTKANDFVDAGAASNAGKTVYTETTGKCVHTKDVEECRMLNAALFTWLHQELLLLHFINGKVRHVDVS